jgi:mannose-6-phosphate isomerase-like protein (cupin superfamily)
MQLTNYELYHENKSHTSPEFPYNTYLCSIPLDFPSVKIHWHEEAEIIVIKKGEGIVSVDLTEYHVQTGDIIFVMSGQLHSISQFQNNTMEYENIIFKPNLLKAVGNDLCWGAFLPPPMSKIFATSEKSIN